MLTKLALKNFSKNLKDYTIYFFTLVFAVSIFYMFNSIYEQGIALKLNSNLLLSLANMQGILAYVSVFVAFILGLLIVYANYFFMKRRKNEIGIYLSLGMNKNSILLVFIIELLVMASLALFLGILLGMGLSQLMSIFTANMFEADLKKYQFVFSKSAALKSVLYFSTIFIVVLLINLIIVGRQSIIKIIKAKKKREKFAINNVWLNAVVFFVALACIGYSYYLLLNTNPIALPHKMGQIMGLGSLGTLLFFASFIKLIIIILRKIKAVYFNGLNMFVLAQINNKVSSGFLSMTIISLSLFIVILVFSGGYSISSFANKVLNQQYTYDFSFYKYKGDSTLYDKLPKPIKESAYIKDSYEFTYYDMPDTAFNIDENDSLEDKEIDESKVFGSKLIGLKDFNQLLNMNGKEKAELMPKEYIIVSNFIQDSFMKNQLLFGNYALNLSRDNLYPKDKTYDITIKNAEAFICIVVDDSYLKELKAEHRVLNINCKNKKASIAMQNEIELMPKENSYFDSIESKIKVATETMGIRGLVSYISIYISLVFMLSSAAVLALQQLSYISDNYEAYRLVQELGASKKNVNIALFNQILVYFLMPLLMAILHGIITMQFALQLLKFVSLSDISNTIVSTAGFVIAIYGIYFLLSYFTCKSMVLKK